MSTHKDKLIALVDKLIASTASGSIGWKAEGASAVYAALNSARIEVKEDRDDTGQDAVRITLFDEVGNSNLSFDDTAVLRLDSMGNAISYYGKMKELLASALRYARGEDEILNAVLSELDDLDIPF